MTNDEVTHALQHLIGTQYVESLKAQIAEATGRQRVVGPDDISTKEFDPTRIHICADGSGAITGFAFN